MYVWMRKAVLFTGLLLFMNNCGKSDKQPEKQVNEPVEQLHILDSVEIDSIEESKFSGWESQAFDNITICYPPDYSDVGELPDLAKKYGAILRASGRLLQMNFAADPVVVAVFIGPQGAYEVFEDEWPRASNDTIFQWPPFHHGLSAMEYVVERWSPGEKKYDFIKHGLMKLLDGSGRNYHSLIISYIDDDMFIPIEELVVHPKFNSYGEKHQSAIAASLVDFILFKYGSETLKKIYESEDDVSTLTQNLLGITPDSLQTIWLQTARQAAKK